MLKRLSIQNYAIISEIGIDYSNNLNVITGETGAGKSIIAGALGLILGDRADSSVLLIKDKKCVVEGIFDCGNKQRILDFMKENELDADSEIVLRREIAVNGKSRAFVNDTPVNVSQLQQLSALLVDLHQQFDTLELGESDFQREVIDALAGTEPVINNYRKKYFDLIQQKKELSELTNRKQDFQKEFDYTKFQFDELAEAGFKQNELEDLDNELRMLTNAEGIKSALGLVYHFLKESEQPVVNQLKTLHHQLESFSAYHTDLPGILSRLESSRIELQDIAGEVERISDHINYDPAKIEQINERLALGYRLQKKHGAGNTNELIQIKDQLEAKLEEVLNIDDLILSKEKRITEITNEAKLLAQKISDARKKHVKPFENNVNDLLKKVGMPNARVMVRITETDLNSWGMDSIEFLFNANKTDNKKSSEAADDYKPVRRVASGGELSRLMLCIKSLVARSMDLPTLIFDEIDTGISGEAAKQVGIILKELASKRQVICITHQPQIAGKADAHYFVFKEISGNSIKTNIRLLSRDERITTIARMLSGEKPTAAALENAREMMN